LDVNGVIDQDYYTARKYFKLMSVPLEDRCSHSTEKPDSKEELIKRIGSMPERSELRDLLADIVRRLS
jgi:hypothetical protein